MADDKTKIGYADREKINQREPYEVELAAKEIKTSPTVIRGAIAKVGVMREKVAEYVKHAK